jgi:hypothetical protein
MDNQRIRGVAARCLIACLIEKLGLDDTHARLCPPLAQSCEILSFDNAVVGD